MGKLQPERFETAFFYKKCFGFFSAIKSWDALITYLLEREMELAIASFAVVNAMIIVVLVYCIQCHVLE